MPAARIPALDHYQIGFKLRTLRAERQLTLSRLAAEARLSTALLSKLETDRMIPTLQTLSKLCSVYGVGLSYFFSEPSKHSVAISRKDHFSPIRASQETVRRLPLLHSPLGTANCTASMLEFSEGSLVTASEPGKPLACLVYVVAGKLRVELGGVRETLALGDCAAIDTDMSVMWGREGQDPCQVLIVDASAK